ncbi:MAG: insulinase family protein [Smithellaceae bacterium]|nr:insulinase family protein [Smithellaceae bacterium]
MNSPDITLKAGDNRQGFLIRRVESIPEIRVMAFELTHEATGARVLHLHCDDPENLFAIAFRTPPGDSTGVPHILEHAVLAGSARYPLKDVFNELMKGSLQTFINAFTYPDKTIYPVASQNRTDFFNLARVYADLVFNPRLLRETFLQEGHHLEFAEMETAASDLITSGIVYNEMKGAYSSPETLMYRSLQQAIFPDNTYACDSGGDPRVIPTLTYEALKSFHQSYYSPSNARFFLYGNIKTEDHLVFLAEILAGFQKVKIDSSIPLQQRRNEPIRIHGQYPLGKEEDEAAKTIVNLAWLLTENTDYETALLLEIAAGALMGTAASPLRKALIDSGLGQDISPVTGMERDFRQLVFALGLRGTDPDKAADIEELIFRVLGETAEAGFDRELIEGMIHQVEFHGREIVRGGYPYGIVLMGRVFHSWLYDGDPLAGLNFPRLIHDIRRKWEADPGLFEKVIKAWLIDNPHRVLSVMTPSKTMIDEEVGDARSEMARLKSSYTPEELEKIREEALRLREYQIEQDPPEVAACLPRLPLAEISPQADRIPSAENQVMGPPAMIHEIFTNGIGYLDLAFDIGHIPEELQPYLPLLGKITLNMGAGDFTYEEMAKRIALRTGGLGYQLGAGGILRGDGKPWQKMIFRVKSLYRNMDEAVKIMADLFCAGDLSHEGRMSELILEKKNGLHAAVIPSGHIFARRSAAAGLNAAAWRDEQWHGRSQLRFIHQIASNLPAGRAELAETLAKLRQLVFSRQNLTLNLTADREGIDHMRTSLGELVDRLPSGKSAGTRPGMTLTPASLALSLPSQVSYVAKAITAPTYDDPRSPYLTIISRFLGGGYLYKHIRVQGGAYGAMSQYDQLNGIFAFLSYRDPHILETLEVYRQAGEYIAQYTLNPEELDKAIIGTIASLDKPMDPAGRGFAALIRRFSGLTDQDRDDFRQQILGATPKDLQEAAASYFPTAMPMGNVAVYGNEENLKAAGPGLANLTFESLL